MQATVPLQNSFLETAADIVTGSRTAGLTKALLAREKSIQFCAPGLAQVQFIAGFYFMHIRALIDRDAVRAAFVADVK